VLFYKSLSKSKVLQVLVDFTGSIGNVTCTSQVIRMVEVLEAFGIVFTAALGFGVELSRRYFAALACCQDSAVQSQELEVLDNAISYLLLLAVVVYLAFAGRGDVLLA
jgi:hypothetical protein